MERIGIDIGNVIIGGHSRDTSLLGENYLQALPVDGAVEGVRTLVECFGQEHVFLVSKAGAWMQIKTRKWLGHTNFFEVTGVNPAHIAFCLERPEKARLCASLRITHFVDDSLEVLFHLDQVANRYLFGQPCQRDTQRYGSILPSIHQVLSWDELTQKVPQN